MHRLLDRQLKRLGATAAAPPTVDQWQAMLEDISAAYTLADQDRQLLERSLELTSDELVERNQELQAKVDQQAGIMDRLRAAVSLHEATLEATDDGILVVDLDGIVTSRNSRFHKMWRLPSNDLGTPSEQLIKRVLGQLVDPRAFVNRIMEIGNEPRATSFDVVELIDGRVYERFSRPQILDDEVVGRVWSFRDVTDARRSRTQLELERSRLAAVVSNAPITVFAADAAGVLTLLEGHRLSEIGLDPDHAVGHSVLEACAATSELVDAMRETLGGATFSKVLELDCGVFDIYLAPTLNARGEVDGLMGVANDITQRWELQKQAKRHDEQLTRTARLSSLGTLVAGVAHEINNPLMYMRGHLDLVSHKIGGMPNDESAGVRASLTKVREGTDRIEHIASSLKVFASGSGAEKKHVDLTKVLDEVGALVAVELPPGVVLERAEHDAPAWVQGNTVQIHQVVLNLVQNAIQAVTTEGGLVTLRTVVEGDHVVAHITDDGPGMPPEVQAQAFTPFFTTKASGTGLGLALANTVVKEHGGSITFDSDSSGTHFFLRFPLARPATVSEADVAAASNG